MLLLIPAFVHTRLAPTVDWATLLGQYWLGLGARAIFCATFLYGAQHPAILKTIWARAMQQPGRFIVALVFSALMVFIFGVALGSVVAIDGFALAELLDSSEGRLDRFTSAIKPLVLPAVYLFLGLVMVFTYNDLAACLVRMDSYDWLYLKLDSWIAPTSVSDLSRSVLTHASPWLLHAIEFIYYGMFGQIGAGLIVVSMTAGKRQGVRYVGTIMTAYFVALALFFAWPSMGPFYTCTSHFTTFPASLSTYGIQQTAILKAKLLAAPSYRPFNKIETDYFIAFPCMHVAQPLIVLWFLRRYKRMAVILVCHDILLVPAILLLEWHYYSDLVGGVLVTGAAIYLNSSDQWFRLFREKRPRLGYSQT